MLKKFYKSFLPVYFGSGKRQFCSTNCVWFDDGKKQDCLKCKVNILACTCNEFFDEKSPSASDFTMEKAIKKFERHEKELFH